jgi:hypothetical protein
MANEGNISCTPQAVRARVTLLATTIRFGAAAFFAPQSPNADFFSASAQAQS